MNCFVIMPFKTEFDDVYAAIKSSFEASISPRVGVCTRLDDARPAGQITERLLREIEATALCIADVTGNVPNVMWELGFAMALRKPTILVTQNIASLPFDIKDLQAIEYNRAHISRTLTNPLRKSLLDTFAGLSIGVQTSDPLRQRDALLSELLAEVHSLKGIIGDVVKSWAPGRKVDSQQDQAAGALVGAWRNSLSRTHHYAKVVNGELIAPYCYLGNHSLTGVYFDWKRAGDYWFAKFAWLDAPISGFSFLRPESVDVLTGAWWGDESIPVPLAPPQQEGVRERWERLPGAQFPEWASDFLHEVEKNSLANVLALHSRNRRWF